MHRRVELISAVLSAAMLILANILVLVLAVEVGVAGVTRPIVDVTKLVLLLFLSVYLLQRLEGSLVALYRRLPTKTLAGPLEKNSGPSETRNPP